MTFIMYFIRWVSSNLSVPFWMVGHVHLTMNIYEDIIELWASVVMNLLVVIGFYLDWKEHKQTKNEK